MESKLVRHGEVLLKAIDSLPKEAKLIEETNSYVVAHSETGHNHRLQVKEKTDLSKFKVYTWNGETYLEVPQMAELLHEKTGKDAHKTHTITPNIYKVVIKKEFDYFKGIIRQVRD
jgi:hypothetical protein